MNNLILLILARGLQSNLQHLQFLPKMDVNPAFLKSVALLANKDPLDVIFISEIPISLIPLINGTSCLYKVGSPPVKRMVSNSRTLCKT